MLAHSTAGTPVHSITRSTRRSSSSGVVPVLTVRVAPSSAATASRWSLTSVTMTSVAPAARATWATRSPMGPAPVTSTRWPILTWARCTAHTATASGSIIEPTTVSMVSGSGCAARSGATRYSVMVPWVGGEPKQVPFGQTL